MHSLHFPDDVQAKGHFVCYPVLPRLAIVSTLKCLGVSRWSFLHFANLLQVKAKQLTLSARRLQLVTISLTALLWLIALKHAKQLPPGLQAEFAVCFQSPGQQALRKRKLQSLATSAAL